MRTDAPAALDAHFNDGLERGAKALLETQPEPTPKPIAPSADLEKHSDNLESK
jgi:hypothetical protein